MTQRSLTSQVTPHYPLKEAASHFFPAGGVTVATLRTEIRNGNLDVTRIAGKFFVTEADIATMLERCKCEGETCRADENHQDSISGDKEAHNPSGRSETGRLESARNVLSMSRPRPKRSLPNI